MLVEYALEAGAGHRLAPGVEEQLRAHRRDPDGLTGKGVPNNGLGAVISKAPPSASQVGRWLQTPFSDELTVGFEREVAPDVAFKITCISRNYEQQLQDIDVNHSLRLEADGTPRDAIGEILQTGKRNPDGRPGLYIHNFFFNRIFRVGNFNDARYRAVEVSRCGWPGG